MTSYNKTLEKVFPITQGGGGGGSSSLFKSLVDRTITEVTAKDLAGCTSIGAYSFTDVVSLTSITIPNSVTTIGAYALSGCRGLTSIVIPGSITDIKIAAFNNCRSLTSVTILATTPPTLDNANAFNLTNDCPIYVPAASVDTYKGATNWSSLASRIFAIQE